jgi:hypothetical protein
MDDMKLFVRIVMLLYGEDNLREVVLFPMNQRAEDLMMGAPLETTAKQSPPGRHDATERRHSPQNSLRLQSILPTISRSPSGVSSLACLALSQMTFTRIGREACNTCKRRTIKEPNVSRMA